MCDFAERVTKLCQIAGQAEYELMTMLAPLWHHRNDGGSISRGEVGRARRFVELRGDAWSLSTFNRVMDFLKENPEVCEQLAKDKINSDPVRRADAIQAYLDHVERPGYPEALICEEVSDLVHELENTSG
jgi:hypothetical protein